MFDFIKKHCILFIVIICILCFSLLFLTMTLLSPSSKEDEMGDGANSYQFSEEVVSYPGSQEYSNDDLKKEHCQDNICIINLTFQYADNLGRVDYTILNKTKKTVTGYYYLIFGEQKLLVAFKDLAPGKSVTTYSQYFGIEIEDKTGYVLRKATEEELSKIRGIEKNS